MTSPALTDTRVAEAPYQNLILTGFLGAGKTNVGRTVAQRLGVSFFDLETEVQLREGLSADEIRALFGEARLRTLEVDICRELSLRRGSVLAISATTMLDETNRNRLTTSGPVLVLTCALDEILRRLHAAQGARFHDPRVRASALHQLRRDQQIRKLTEFPIMDTTLYTIDDVAEKAITFWREHDMLSISRWKE